MENSQRKHAVVRKSGQFPILALRRPDVKASLYSERNPFNFVLIHPEKPFFGVTFAYKKDSPREPRSTDALNPAAQ